MISLWSGLVLCCFVPRLVGAVGLDDVALVRTPGRIGGSGRLGLEGVGIQENHGRLLILMILIIEIGSICVS